MAARILIYTATREYRHECIPTAIDALQSRGSQYNITFDATEDQGRFTDDSLQQYDALLFMHNSGEVLDDAGKAAFQRYLDLGGNYIGVHAASACLDWTPFYQNTVGAIFDYHPDLQDATFLIVDTEHPTTNMLPARWTLREEVYNFRSDPRAIGAQLLLTVDEASYTDTKTTNYTDGDPHPIAWYQERLAGTSSTGPVGRSWYSSLGHEISTWQDDTFLAHVFAGITWALASNTTRAFNPDGLVGNNPSTSTLSVQGASSTTSVSPGNDASHQSAPILLSALVIGISYLVNYLL